MGRDDHGETTGYVVRSRRCRGTPDILADRSESCRRRTVAMADGLTRMTDAPSVAWVLRVAAFDQEPIFVAAGAT
ncbi:hypothetical protein CFB40_17710 [Burkholderia sp. AU31652]|nr:hypothetical protein CFB40_17710 [Burkholderia sp. AU31652]